MTEEVIRSCGLPHHGLRTPTLSNTHQFLCWPANGGSTLRSLSDQITSGSEGLSPFESARNATLMTTAGIAPPLRFAFWVSSGLASVSFFAEFFSVFSLFLPPQQQRACSSAKTQGDPALLGSARPLLLPLLRVRMRDHVPAYIGLVEGALVHANALQLLDRNINCCHLCPSRHLLCADCACFQGTTVISIYIPSARWAGVRGTVLLGPYHFPCQSPRSI